MAGFDYAQGRSNNMLAAESAGKITIGRWAKRYGVSARAAVEVMSPSEAHHTGTGRRGKSRLTPVIDSDLEPTPDQLAEMQTFDAEAKAAKARGPQVHANCTVRYVRFAKSRGRYIPEERIERVDECEIHAGGKIRCRRGGIWTRNWQGLSGLMIVCRAGDCPITLIDRIDTTYDSTAEVLRRIVAFAK